MKNWRSALAGIVGIVMLAAPAMARADSLDATSTSMFGRLTQARTGVSIPGA